MIPGPKAPEGAPNVLLVLIDDAGFGAIDTFGGPVSTPTFTRVQQMGLTYNRFHVTAVCSPTRAALLTGRNQHRVGLRLDRRVPRARSPATRPASRRSCAGVPAHPQGERLRHRRLRQVAPDAGQRAGRGRARSTTGPSRGASTTGGASCPAPPASTTRSSPRTTATLGVPEGKDGKQYYFPDDITDKAVEWLHAVRAQDAQQAVVHVLLDRLRPRPAPRRQGVGRQVQGQVRRRLGRAARADASSARRSSASSRRTPSSPSGPTPSRPGTRSTDDAEEALRRARWRSTPATRRTPTGTSAGCSTPIEEMGDLDNTLIFYIWGDNGASLEGTITGSFNEMTFLNGLVLDAEQQLALIEQYGGIEALGGDHTAPHIAAAWAHACNTPFQWGKQTASHLGGTRDPMVVAWPSRIKAGRGDARPVHPLSSTSARRSSRRPASPSPRSVDGIAQEPMDGTSFLYTLRRRRRRPSGTPRSTSRCSAAARMYKDGWWAASRPDRLPWDVSPADARAVRPGRRLGPGPRRRLGAVRPDRRTSPRRTTSPPSTRTRSRSSRSCGGRRPSATGCCR